MHPNPDRVRKQNRWLRQLCNVEDVALRMAVPMDLMTIDPEIVVCPSGALRDVFDYWRVVLSSEPQNPGWSGSGRSMSGLVRDKVSGGFLGIVAISDPPTHWPQLLKHLEWDKDDGLRLAYQQYIMMMRRCLPLYEFGQMTGGKMLALAATSRDVIRMLELRFSFQYLFFGIRTLHGKGSQYNRLQANGIALLDVDATNHGFYGMALRRKSVAFMQGKASSPGKSTTTPLSEQLQFWKDRWLTSRMKSLGVGSIITPDPEKYRLSSQLSVKRMTLRDAGLLKEDPNGPEAEED